MSDIIFPFENYSTCKLTNKEQNLYEYYIEQVANRIKNMEEFKYNKEIKQQIQNNIEKESWE